MSRLRCGLVIALALGVVGCRMGPKIEDIQAANSPAGVTTNVVTRSAQYDGELLAARDDDLLLIVEGRVTLIPYGIVESIRPQDLAHLDGDDLQEVPPKKLERLRLWTRYPKGVTEDLLRRLLRAYGQLNAVVVGS